VYIHKQERGPEEEERRLELLLIGKRPKIRSMKEQKRPIKIRKRPRIA
jgi:hypothetical protein